MVQIMENWRKHKFFPVNWAVESIVVMVVVVVIVVVVIVVVIVVVVIVVVVIVVVILVVCKTEQAAGSRNIKPVDGHSTQANHCYVYAHN